jgi:SAM-dependent methyltransferase
LLHCILPKQSCRTAEERAQRRLAALLAADVVGYSTSRRAKMVEQHEGRTDFYSVRYAYTDSELAGKLRREVYGEDIGQQNWCTAAEQTEIANLLRVAQASHVLDVCCGSGGPSLALAERTGCRLTGVDLEDAGIACAQSQASARGLADRATFAVRDCDRALPYEEGRFDAVLCVDAVSHLRDRFGTLREWARLLRAGGRLVFTDHAVITGPVAKSEFDIRTATGFFLFVPPGVNEEAIKAAGLVLLRREDRTAAIAEVAARWRAARARYTAALEREEGIEGFERRQRFYATAAELATSRRLSRFLYVAEKPTQS